ncbi:MAG: DUF4167 domain-containing protein [Croceibacterium sp.]
MNQNRNNNNNRRRGRGNNRGGQGGVGSQGNRIDSRARGNAPQMLEKYRKLAHDASLNGDRVQTEYYLQFADHYFRVVADSRQPRDDQAPRRDDGVQAQGYDYTDEDDLAEVGRPNAYQPRRVSEDSLPQDAESPSAERDEEATDEPNPFVRESRERRPRQRTINGVDEGASGTGEVHGDEPAGFDPGVLPPSIARDAEEAPASRPRARRPRRDKDGGGETREAAG